MGSTCTSGFRLRRPARLAVLSPKTLATQPCETSCRMMDGTTAQKMTMSVVEMLWWTTSATTRTAPATIHSARLVRGSMGRRLPEGAPGGYT
jgi:hypothetical protein